MSERIRNNRMTVSIQNKPVFQSRWSSAARLLIEAGADAAAIAFAMPRAMRSSSSCGCSVNCTGSGAGVGGCG